MESSVAAAGSAGYFNASLRTGGSLATGVNLAGIASDAVAMGGTPNPQAGLVGGRFGGYAANSTTRAIGAIATGDGSTTANVGIVAATTINPLTIAAALPAATNAAVLGVSGTNAGTNYAGYFAGDVAVTGATVKVANIPTTGATLLVGRDASNNLVTTPLPTATTASNGLTSTAGDVKLGGMLSTATTIDQATNPLAFTNAGKFSVNGGTAAATERLVIAPNGNIKIGNAPSAYTDNKVEIDVAGIGSSANPSGEDGQGVNILATTAATLSSTAIGSRIRVDVTGTTGATARGSQANINVNSGSTLTGTATGSYSNAAVKGGSIATLTGAAADADYVSGTVTTSLVGGRFGANGGTGIATPTFGIYGTAVGSNTANTAVTGLAAPASGGFATGVVGAVNMIPSAISTATAGRNIGVAAINAGSTAADRAIYSDGAVQMRNITGTTGDMMVIDNNGIVGKTAAPAALTAGSGITLSGNQIAVNEATAHTWTGTQEFQATATFSTTADFNNSVTVNGGLHIDNAASTIKVDKLASNTPSASTDRLVTVSNTGELTTSGMQILSATGTVNFTATPAGEGKNATNIIAVPGAVEGDVVMLGLTTAAYFPAPANPSHKLNYVAWVSAAGQVQVRLLNYNNSTPVNATSLPVTIKIIK